MSKELKIKTDKALQDLFTSYAKQLREALHEMLGSSSDHATKVPPPTPLPFEEACVEWLRKVEAYI